jgi:hypothetical protein
LRFTLRLRLHRGLHPVDRCWLLTWTTYGNWLPGDERGFVSAVRDQTGTQTTHNRPRTEYDRDHPHLERYSKAAQKLGSVKLNREQAAAVCRQIQTTAEHRHWKLFAVAVMANHVHVVVGVPGDPDPSTLLRSRVQSPRSGSPESGPVSGPVLTIRKSPAVVFGGQRLTADQSPVRTLSFERGPETGRD